MLAAAAVVVVKLIIILLAPEAALAVPSNYSPWGLGEGADVGEALRFLIRGGILAPISEEVLFRGGVQGGLLILCGLWRPLRRIEFWGPALVSAFIFVCLHETSNGVFILIRMIGALALARVFYDAGLLAAIAMHGAGNLFWAVLIVSERFFGFDGVALSLAGMVWIFGSACIIWAPWRRFSWTAAVPRQRKLRRCPAAIAALCATMIVVGTFTAGGSPLYLLAFLGLVAMLFVRALILAVRLLRLRVRGFRSARLRAEPESASAAACSSRSHPPD